MPSNMPLDVLVEAVLFYKGAPQKITTLKKLFDVSDEDWQRGVDKLESRLENTAIRLVKTETEIRLVTAPELSEFIEAMRKDELASDIGKAGAETLAIILYRGPITRGEIDRIRGVNSAFILRNLLTRGLITRQAVKNTYQFETSTDLLQHLGVTDKQKLPNYKQYMDSLDEFTTKEETI